MQPLSPENLCWARGAKMQCLGDDRSYMQVPLSLYLLITVERSVLQPASSGRWNGVFSNLPLVACDLRRVPVPTSWANDLGSELIEGCSNNPLSYWWLAHVPKGQLHAVYQAVPVPDSTNLGNMDTVTWTGVTRGLMGSLPHVYSKTSTWIDAHCCRVLADCLTTKPDWTRCFT